MKIIESEKGISFTIKVQPRASINKVVGVEGEFLKVKLTAPPIEGKANKALIKLLSKKLNVKRSDVDIIVGGKAKIKTVRIRSLSRAVVVEKLGGRISWK